MILTDREVPYTNELKDAMDDKYILLTNSFGSVDVFYLNQSGNHVSQGICKFLRIMFPDGITPHFHIIQADLQTSINYTANNTCCQGMRAYFLSCFRYKKYYNTKLKKYY